MGPTVVLDACVLYPAPLRDLLMWISTSRLMVPHWSDRIIAEWVDSLLRNRSDRSADQLARTCAEMNRALPLAMTNGGAELVPTLHLPDADDRHVLATAIASQATVILTFNLKDFPDTALPGVIRAMAPDPFLCGLFDAGPIEMLAAMRSHRGRLRKPPKSPEEYVETLAKNNLSELARRIAAHLGEI